MPGCGCESSSRSYSYKSDCCKPCCKPPKRRCYEQVVDSSRGMPSQAQVLP